MAAWYIYPEKENVDGAIAFATKRKQDKDFAKPKVALEQQGRSLGNPICFEAHSGTVILMYVTLEGAYWNNAVVHQTSSKDGGVTWERPHRLSDEKGLMLRHPPIKNFEGHWILGVYQERTESSQIYISKDDGETWSLDHEFPRTGLIQPCLVRHKSTILCFFRPCSEPNVVWMSRLERTGWQAASQTKVTCPLSGVSAVSDGQDILVVHNNTYKQQRHPLSITRLNFNVGQIQQSYPWDFDNVKLELSYPSFATDSEGQTHGVYTYNRRMIKYVSFTPTEVADNSSGMKPTSTNPADYDVTYYKDLHQDKNLFIIASGPSINSLDLSPLTKRITMGLNRSGLIFPETTYQCVMDQNLFDDYEDMLKKTRTLFTLEGRPFGIPIHLLGTEGFSFDLGKGVYSGYTISFLALQLAVYMGFKRVFFLGLDLKHATGKTHFFGHDFRSKDHETTEFPKMLRMMKYAAETLKGKGTEIYNLSPQSALSCFEKISYDKALTF